MRKVATVGYSMAVVALIVGGWANPLPQGMAKPRLEPFGLTGMEWLSSLHAD